MELHSPTMPITEYDDAPFYLESLVDSSDDAILSKTLDGVVTSWNRAAERMFGYLAEEIIGRPLAIIFPADHRDEESAILRTLHRGGRIEHLETVRLHKDGTRIEVLATVSPVHDGGGRIIGASTILHDITNRKMARNRIQELQSELLHASRLSTLGQAASALAHELNQPLSAVMSYLAALRRLIAKGECGPERLTEIIDRAAEQAGRAGEIIHQLRDFGRKRGCERKWEDLNKTVEVAVGLALLGTKSPKAKVMLHLQPELRPVFIDRVQIEQVVVNLVRNAMEAMAGCEKRELRIATARRLGEGAVVITVADTGPGVPAKLAAHPFKPFVSTKRDGLGLGLSISRDIVEAHGGELSISANGGAGAAFSVRLPVEEDKEADGRSED